jgi:hypothetical protein
MLRVFAITALLMTAIVPVARAEPGADGYVTAYDLDGRTVIETKPCFKTGRYLSYDYARCMSRLRDSMKWKLCRERGQGTHHYLYQWGTGRLSRTSTYCNRRY